MITLFILFFYIFFLFNFEKKKKTISLAHFKISDESHTLLKMVQRNHYDGSHTLRGSTGYLQLSNAVLLLANFQMRESKQSLMNTEQFCSGLVTNGIYRGKRTHPLRISICSPDDPEKFSDDPDPIDVIRTQAVRDPIDVIRMQAVRL